MNERAVACQGRLGCLHVWLHTLVLDPVPDWGVVVGSGTYSVAISVRWIKLHSTG